MTDNTAVRRTAGSRCVACNQRMVDAYFCDLCGQRSTRKIEEPVGSSAGRVARAAQRRLDRETAHDHWMYSLSLADEEYHSPQRFTRTEHARWDKNLASIGNWRAPQLSAHRIGGLNRRRWLRFCALWPKIVDAIKKQEQRLAERQHKRWTRFCEVWSKIGLNIITRVVSAIPLPRPQRRPRLSRELLDLLDPPLKQRRTQPPSQLTLDRVAAYVNARTKLSQLIGHEDFSTEVVIVERIYAGLTSLERDLLEEL